MRRSVFTAGAKCFVPGIAMLILLAMNQMVARADTVTFQGTTDGAFNSTGFSNPATLFGLTFNGNTFQIGTVDTNTSTLTLVGPPINLGTFTLNGDFPTSPLNTFSLRLVITFSPPGVGTTQPSAIAEEAFILAAPDGGLIIDFFSNEAIPFSVSVNGIGIASFSLTIDDIHIQQGQTVNVVGAVAPVPEPMTLLMLSTGLAGAGAAGWKRRKSC